MNALLQSRVDFLEGNGAVIPGVIEGQYHLVIIDEHRIHKRLYELFSAAFICIIHIRKSVQKVKDMLFL